MVRERIHTLGQIEFDEVRSVLDQDDLLLPPGDDVTTYTELVALYLELRELRAAHPGPHLPVAAPAPRHGGDHRPRPRRAGAARRDPARAGAAEPRPIRRLAHPAAARASRPDLLVPSAVGDPRRRGLRRHARRQGNFARAAMMSCRAAESRRGARRPHATW